MKGSIRNLLGDYSKRLIVYISSRQVSFSLRQLFSSLPPRAHCPLKSTDWEAMHGKLTNNSCSRSQSQERVKRGSRGGAWVKNRGCNETKRRPRPRLHVLNNNNKLRDNMPPHQFKCYCRAIKTKKNTATISNEQAEVNQMKGSLFLIICVYT
jgi:hypothetical protein